MTELRPAPADVTTTDLYIALRQDINKVDSLAGLIADRLTVLSDADEGPPELYALSLAAEAIVDRLQLLLDKVLQLERKGAALQGPGLVLVPQPKNGGAQ